MGRFIQDLKKQNNPQITLIGNYLLELSESDKLIEASLNKKNKSLKEMMVYIRSEAQKLATNQMAMVEDPVVYGWATHYYDEDSIAPLKKTKVSKNKVSEKKLVELPEEAEDAFDF